MDTIPHSTMGDLVWRLRPECRRCPSRVSANASSPGLRTPLDPAEAERVRLERDPLYGIWQNSGDRSPNYALAGGTSVRRRPKVLERAVLIDCDERTGTFGAGDTSAPANKPTLLGRFEGITGVPSGFNVVVQTTNDQVGIGRIAVDRPGFGPARGLLVAVRTSSLCSGGCKYRHRQHRLPKPGDGHLHPNLDKHAQQLSGDVLGGRYRGLKGRSRRCDQRRAEIQCWAAGTVAWWAAGSRESASIAPLAATAALLRLVRRRGCELPQYSLLSEESAFRYARSNVCGSSRPAS